MAGRERSPKKAKRFRSAFTTDQINYLEIQFKKYPYIGNAQRKEVAIALNIPERAVKIWFQNRRMKEKKEFSSKEFDDESSCFAKDQLNNVCTPSANERPPLPLLVDGNNTNASDIITNNNVSYSLITGPHITDSGLKESNLGTSVNMEVSSPHPMEDRHPLATNNTKSEHSINLYKNYKHQFNRSQNVVKPRMADQKIIQSIECKPKNCKHLEQMIPEDLSIRKTSISATGQIPVSNIIPNNPGFISMVPTVSPFYTQPYYSASGVIWKPVSMVSTAPGASITPAVHESVSKQCGCDCHVKRLVPCNIQQQSPTPQYIITAVPFASPT